MIRGNYVLVLAETTPHLVLSACMIRGNYVLVLAETTPHLVLSACMIRDYCVLVLAETTPHLVLSACIIGGYIKSGVDPAVIFMSLQISLQAGWTTGGGVVREVPCV